MTDIPQKFLKMWLYGLGREYRMYHIRLKNGIVKKQRPVWHKLFYYTRESDIHSHSYDGVCRQAGNINDFHVHDEWVSPNLGKGLCFFCPMMWIYKKECWKVFDQWKLIHDESYIRMRMNVIKLEIRYLKNHDKIKRA